MGNIKYSWNDVEGQILSIARQLIRQKWYPDYIVGISDSGIIPAKFLSSYLEIPMFTLDAGEESNCWMSEDAFGYDGAARKNILIIDAENKYGSAISWIKDDWQKSCFPKDPKWNDVWANNVKFAVLVDHISSQEYVQFSVENINDSDIHVIFPWEEWWK